MPEPQTPLHERPWENVEAMVSVDDALTRILSAFAPLPAVSMPLLNSLGLTLAEAVLASEDVPPFRNSAMDGYAVRAADTAGASIGAPVRLDVIGAVAAGQAAEIPLHAGAAIRVMTGAPIPDGADAVVRFEETDETAYGPRRDQRPDRNWIGITRAAKALDNVREAGEDLRRGTTALDVGTVLRAPEIGLLASVNVGAVRVHRRPRVGILSTGDEVIDLGPPLQPGQIRNSNTYTLAAMTSAFGGEPILLGVARDNISDLAGKLTSSTDVDLLVTSGGVSLGDYDVVKDVMQSEGDIEIWQVRMKPGKPLAFGRIGRTPLLGLPGNPVAAAVSFEQFGRPAILRMLGRQEITPPTVIATLSEPLDNRGHRRHFVRARVETTANGDYRVCSAGDQGAGVLSSLVRANGLLVIPEEIELAEPGMRLAVQLIDWDLRA